MRFKSLNENSKVFNIIQEQGEEIELLKQKVSSLEEKCMPKNESEQYNSYILTEMIPHYRNMLKNYFPNIDESKLKEKEDRYLEDMMMYDLDGNFIPYPQYIKRYLKKDRKEDSDEN